MLRKWILLLLAACMLLPLAAQAETPVPAQTAEPAEETPVETPMETPAETPAPAVTPLPKAVTELETVTEYVSDSLTYAIDRCKVNGKKTYLIRLWLADPGKQICKASSAYGKRLAKAEDLGKKIKGAALVINASGYVSKTYPWIPETYPGKSRDYWYTPLGSLVITNGETRRTLDGVPYTGLTLQADGLHMWRGADNAEVLAGNPTQTWAFYEQCPLIENGEAVLDREWDFAQRTAVRTVIAQIDPNNLVIVISTGSPLTDLCDFILETYHPDWAFNLDGGPSTALMRRLQGKKTLKLIYGARQKIVDVMGFVELPAE